MTLDTSRGIPRGVILSNCSYRVWAGANIDKSCRGWRVDGPAGRKRSGACNLYLMLAAIAAATSDNLYSTIKHIFYFFSL